MSTINIQTDEFFVDAAAEVLNIGMGVAAAALSQMIDKQVLLSAPSIEFVTKSAVANIISPENAFNVSGVSESFSGDLNGTAILLFPERQSLKLVAALLRQNDASLENLSEMEQEAITEIGNVILNACLSSIADMLHKPIEGAIPEFVNGSVEQILELGNSVELNQKIVLLLKMDFSIEEMAIQGYVTFLMDAGFIADFKVILDDFFSA